MDPDMFRNLISQQAADSPDSPFEVVDGEIFVKHDAMEFSLDPPQKERTHFLGVLLPIYSRAKKTGKTFIRIKFFYRGKETMSYLEPWPPEPGQVLKLTGIEARMKMQQG
jgi:hypothetical protein